MRASTVSSTAGRASLLVAVALVLGLAVGGRTTPGVAPAGAVPAQDRRPNVVVIETDDQTAESLRVMENVKQLLVRQGVQFQHSFSSYPLCCPSRATLLTGQYAHNHGVLGNVPPRGGFTQLRHRSTLPVWLQHAGYHTAFVGKYLNGYGDRNRYEIPPGWSDWRAMLRKPGSQSQLYQGFTLNENGMLVDYPRKPSAYLTDVLTNHARDAIAFASASDTPFFLLLQYFAPHNGRPLDPDDLRAPGISLTPRPAFRHRNLFAGEPFRPPPSFDEADVSDKPPVVRNLPRLSTAQLEAIREAYEQRLESLLAVDEGIADVFDGLRAAGELANTLVVFTSDNGYMLGEHRIPPDRGKGSVYEPSVRVPLVVRGPGLPRGKRVTELVSNVDLAPTILEATGARAGLPLDGLSLLSVARGVSGPLRRDILLESSTYSAIRTDRYVYVAHRSGARELYDLNRDPHQLRSRHDDPALASLRAVLAARLQVLRTCARASCRQRAGSELG